MSQFKGVKGLKKTDLDKLFNQGYVTLSDGTYIEYSEDFVYVDDEEIPFTIYEMLDIEEWSLNNPYRLFYKSFSFGDLHIERSMGDILIDVINPEYKPYIIKRLKHFGFNPQEESDGRIYVF